MFSSKEYVKEKGAKSGRDRFSYLQALVTEFQDTDKIDAKYQTLSNLVNFAYDPLNYQHFATLGVVDLFLDMLSEDDKTLVEYGMAGICNLCIYEPFRRHILENDGESQIISCLSSENEETVLNAISVMIYISDQVDTEEFYSDSVKECMVKYSKSDNNRLKNLAEIFLKNTEKRVMTNK